MAFGDPKQGSYGKDVGQQNKIPVDLAQILETQEKLYREILAACAVPRDGLLPPTAAAKIDPQMADRLIVSDQQGKFQTVLKEYIFNVLILHAAGGNLDPTNFMPELESTMSAAAKTEVLNKVVRSNRALLTSLEKDLEIPAAHFCAEDARVNVAEAVVKGIQRDMPARVRTS